MNYVAIRPCQTNTQNKYEAAYEQDYRKELRTVIAVREFAQLAVQLAVRTESSGTWGVSVFTTGDNQG